jgi:hypothetical protein
MQSRQNAVYFFQLHRKRSLIVKEFDRDCIAVPLRKTVLLAKTIVVVGKFRLYFGVRDDGSL